MRDDFLKDKTSVYRGAALLPAKPMASFAAVLLLAALCALALRLLSPLPYAAFFQIAAVALTAAALNRVLKKGVFKVEYVLTDGGILVYVTRYGLLSWETAWIDISKAQVRGNKLFFDGRAYDFYPDNRLKQLMNKQEEKLQ